MKIAAPHSWDVTPAEAREIQQQLRTQVVCTGEATDVELVAGVDISVGGTGSTGRAAVVVLDYPGLRPIEQSVVEAEVRFPYVPGLLSFREVPVLIPAFERLRSRPNLIVVDGQGYAHPRRMGLASHLGLLLGLPTIGCAKSRLIGAYEEPAAEAGAFTTLRDGGEQIGAVVRTRSGVKPLFISVGHRLGLDAAVRWVLQLTLGYRLPEPTRLAHRAAAGVVVAPQHT